MQPDAFLSRGLVKILGAHRLQNVVADRFPSVSLRKDVLRQAFRAEAPVFLLRHLKNQFVHVPLLTGFESSSQAPASLAG